MKFSAFQMFKTASSVLWAALIFEVVAFYALPDYFYWQIVVSVWLMLVLVILEEIYYMIEEKVIRHG